MFINNFDPVMFNLGRFELTWYGLVYSLGFLLTLIFMVWVGKNRKIKNFDEEKAYDLLFYLIIGSIITARLFYILFYNLGFYFDNPMQIFAFWNGGMSFHGGLLGGVIATYYFSKKNKIKLLKILDYLVIPASLMLGFGRIANFINSELVGTVADVSWCVYFNGENVCRHPSQLYESLKNFFIFGVLSTLEYKRKVLKLKEGTLFFLFVALYGLLRFLVTFFRVAEDYVLGLGTGQWFSLAMFFVGIYYLYKYMTTYKKK